MPSIKIVSFFWYPFGQIFGGFWLQLGAQNHPKIHPKIIPKASQQANNEKSKIAKNHYNLQYFRALGYLNLGRKTIKNGSNILPKLASKTMLQVGSIWDPTWLHFGMVLAPKLEPNWHQNALKTDPTTHQKNDHILDRLRTDFGSILAPNLAPDWGNQRLFFRLMLALGAILGPRWPPTTPRLPQDPPKILPRAV